MALVVSMSMGAIYPSSWNPVALVQNLNLDVQEALVESSVGHFPFGGGFGSTTVSIEGGPPLLVLLVYLFSGLFHPISNELSEWGVVLIALALLLAPRPGLTRRDTSFA
jgi:hypothetical protein